MTTVGYGDFSAHNYWEHIFAILWMIFGVGFYSYMVGNIIQIIESLDRDNEELQNKLETLKKFQKQTKIASSLYYRIRRHIENNML